MAALSQVVQSRLNISAAQIWKKLAPCMEHSIASASKEDAASDGADVNGADGGGDAEEEEI
jgi:hypothetical protein